MNELVTIGIPTYNRLEYLKEAVASALAQTYPNVEIVISQNPYRDAAVTQAIREWGEAMARRHAQIRFRRNPVNRGSPANFNAIADAARGTYLAFIGDDDRLLPDFAATLVQAMEPDTALAFSNHYWIDRAGHRLLQLSDDFTWRCRRDQLPAGPLEPNVAAIAAWRASISFLSCLMRTSAFRRLRFREDHGNPDWEFCIRLAHEGGRLVFVPEYLCEHRLHDATASAAGLHYELVVPHLLPVVVPPEVEPHKREALAPLVVHAVTCCLLDGRAEEAGAYMRSAYYPRRSAKALLQRLCAAFPVEVGCGLYRLVYQSVRHRSVRERAKAQEFSLFPPREA